MKDFFKFMFSSIIGTIIAIVLILFIFIGSIAALIPKEEAVSVKDNSILKISLNEDILDRSPNNPFDNFNFQNFEPNTPIGLNDILKNIEKAKYDSKIKGIFLDLSTIHTGFATLEEIRDALNDFKETDKFIIAYSDFYSQSAYYLASIADEVYLNPMGNIDYKGLRTELMFFKNALDDLGIEPVIIRGTGNKFKSAVEPFMYDKMSEANRLQTKTFLGSIWDHIVKGISEERQISVEDLQNMADNMTVWNGKLAVENGLIDKLKYIDEVYSEMKEDCGMSENDKLNFISLKKYTKAPDPNRQKGLIKEKIAVVYASGDIVMGKGNKNEIGSESISKAIRKARLDDKIKAIVLRVNSPGGSALASEIILREVDLARKVKPVIASMGDLAASGGYYISCLADTIVASESTITGSIGVFGLLFNIEKLLNNKLGINVDRVTTNSHSDLGTTTRKMTADEKLVIQKNVDEIYGKFLSHVSQGRSLSIEDVDKIGQGRVWSGANAIEKGLVDVFGGLNKAIDIAADKAGIDKYRIVELPAQKDPFDEIISEFTGDVKADIIKSEVGNNYKYYEYLQQTLSNSGYQARMPFVMEIY